MKLEKLDEKKAQLTERYRGKKKTIDILAEKPIIEDEDDGYGNYINNTARHVKKTPKYPSPKKSFIKKKLSLDSNETGDDNEHNDDDLSQHKFFSFTPVVNNPNGKSILSQQKQQKGNSNSNKYGNFGF